MLRLEPLLDRRPSRLSGGEQQRVALARALVREPQAFLMDEPLTNLDAEFRAEMRTEIKHLQDRLGTTMVYVTHDQLEAMSLGHRIAILNKGRLEQVGTPLEVYNRPATLFCARFIGSPPMNLHRRRADGRRADRGRRARAAAAGRARPRAPAHGRRATRGARGHGARARRARSTRGSCREEALGDETIFVVETGGRDLRVRMPPTSRFGAGRAGRACATPARPRLSTTPTPKAGGLMGAIAAEGLRKAFGDVQALDGVDLDVADGAFYVVLGPSGAGKTTTLRAIAGLERLDAGTVRARRARRHVRRPGRSRPRHGVPELRALPEAHGVREHRLAAARPAYALRTRSQARVAEVAGLLHIERLMERKPAQMSGGEMQRVALARALVRRPRAFLMDEPLTNLDLKLRVEMRTELTRIHRSLGGTFLYVTNDQVEAMSMADRVAVLREGKVQQTGAPREVYDRPANRWVAEFMGSPRMNLLPCRADGGRLVGDGGWSLPRPALGARARTGGRCCSALRAEDLSIERRDESAALAGRALRARAARRPHRGRRAGRRHAGEGEGAGRPSPGRRGSRCTVAVDLDRAHLFDAETGDAVAR